MSKNQASQPKLRIAIEGCGHGTLQAIYGAVARSSKMKGWKGVDAVIIGGDFQAVRNEYDLNVTAVPPKYRQMGDFYDYYSGKKKAPYLTIFVGGNHEATNHLFELYYGGWVAPNIYYMGAAGIVNLGPLRIAGLSGIWKGYDYQRPHYERLPYNRPEVTSIFHVRELDTRKLLCVRSQVDVGITHDWPRGVEWNGNHKWLFKTKQGFEEDARAGVLGSVAGNAILNHLRPLNWFAAHLHVKYPAVVHHRETVHAAEEKRTETEQAEVAVNHRQPLPTVIAKPMPSAMVADPFVSVKKSPAQSVATHAPTGPPPGTGQSAFRLANPLTAPVNVFGLVAGSTINQSQAQAGRTPSPQYASSRSSSASGDARFPGKVFDVRNQPSPGNVSRQSPGSRGRSPPVASSAQVLALQKFNVDEQESKSRTSSASMYSQASAPAMNSRSASPQVSAPVQAVDRRPSPPQQYTPIQPADKRPSPPQQYTPVQAAASVTPTTQRNARRGPASRERPPPPTSASGRVNAWQNFYIDNVDKEREEAARSRKEDEEQRAERARSGKTGVDYIIHEVHKRGNSIIKRTINPTEAAKESVEAETADAKIKRDRSISPEDSHKAQKTIHSKNVDEIDVMMTDSSSNASRSVSPLVKGKARAGSILSEDGSDGGARLSRDSPGLHTIDEEMVAPMKAEAATPIKTETINPVKVEAVTPMTTAPVKVPATPAKVENKNIPMSMDQVIDEDVTPEMRAQLAEISSTFSDPPVVRKGDGIHFTPLPAPNIRNRTTNFLALDKVDLNRNFLQMMEVDCISAPATHKHPRGPFKLSYDKEWLAILRTFADELELGGKSTDPIPAFKSPAEYYARIDKEQQWIERNVVQAGKMRIPENFVHTAPVYDPNLQVNEEDQPREYTNPQTSTFCKLIGIENKFDMSEEERTERMLHGPSEFVKPIKVRGGRRGVNNRRRAQEARAAGQHFVRPMTRAEEMSYDRPVRTRRNPGRQQGSGGGW